MKEYEVVVGIKLLVQQDRVAHNMQTNRCFRFFSSVAFMLMLSLSAGAQPPIFQLFQATAQGNLEELNSALREIVRQRSRHLTGEQAMQHAVNSRDFSGFTPIQHAVYYGHTEIVRRLTEAGADSWLNRIDYFDQPIQIAVRRGHFDIVRLLIEWGFNVNSRFGRSYTLLHVAAYWNQPTMLVLLLERGGDLEAVNFYGRTPLQVAQVAGHREVADIIQTRTGLNSAPGRVVADALGNSFGRSWATSSSFQVP